MSIQRPDLIIEERSDYKKRRQRLNRDKDRISSFFLFLSHRLNPEQISTAPPHTPFPCCWSFCLSFSSPRPTLLTSVPNGVNKYTPNPPMIWFRPWACLTIRQMRPTRIRLERRVIRPCRTATAMDAPPWLIY